MDFVLVLHCTDEKKGDDLKPWVCSSDKTISHFFSILSSIYSKNHPLAGTDQNGCFTGIVVITIKTKILLSLFHSQSHRTKKYTNTEQCLGRAMDSGSCPTSRPTLACSKLAWAPLSTVWTVNWIYENSEIWAMCQWSQYPCPVDMGSAWSLLAQEFREESG